MKIFRLKRIGMVSEKFSEKVSDRFLGKVADKILWCVFRLVFLFFVVFLFGCAGVGGADRSYENRGLIGDGEKTVFRKTQVASEGGQDKGNLDISEDVLELLDDLEEDNELDQESAIGEGINRAVFDAFMLGYYVGIHPFIGLYNGVVPQFIRDRVDDFAGTLRVPLTVVNDILQGNGTGLEKTVSRTVKTVPTLGLYDFERTISPRRFEDYGQTLGVYGVPEGPFVMFPLAPTFRDTTAFVGRVMFLDPLKYLVDSGLTWSFLGIRMVSLFSNIDRGMMTAFGSVNSAGAYASARSAFLQQRRRNVADRGQDELQTEILKRQGNFVLNIDQDLSEFYEKG